MFDGIVANSGVLEEEFIPPSLPCRESQKDGLAFCLSPIQKNSRPMDCLCYGKLGTEKKSLSQAN